MAASPDLRLLVAAAAFSAAAVNRRKKAALDAKDAKPDQPAPAVPEITTFLELEASAKAPYNAATARLAKITRWNVVNRDKVGFDLHADTLKNFGSVPFDARAMVETYYNFTQIFKAL